MEPNAHTGDEQSTNRKGNLMIACKLRTRQVVESTKVLVSL